MIFTHTHKYIHILSHKYRSVDIVQHIENWLITAEFLQYLNKALVTTPIALFWIVLFGWEHQEHRDLSAATENDDLNAVLVSVAVSFHWQDFREKTGPLTKADMETWVNFHLYTLQQILKFPQWSSITKLETAYK